MDNQRLILWGLFVIMAYWTWQSWNEYWAPPPTDPAVEESAPLVDDGLGGLPEVSGPAGDTESPDTLPTVDAPATTAAAEPAIGVRAETVVVTTDVARFEISPQGGTIISATMLGYPVDKDDPDTMVDLLSTDPADVGRIRSFLRAGEGREAPDANALWETDRTNYELGDADELVVPLRWAGQDGTVVEKRFVFTRDSYAFRLEHAVTNNADTAWSADQVTQIQRRSYEPDRSMFDVDSYSFDGAQIFDGDAVEKLKRKELLRGAYSQTWENGWYASIEHHFLSAIVPEQGVRNAYFIQVRDNMLTASVIEARKEVAPGETVVFERTLFVGPKLQSQLNEIHPKLRLSVDYGFLTLLSQPMFWLLAWIYKFVGNWGLAIIGVTIVIKLVFYKLTESSGRSMAKMREIQPRMKALQDRYKDDRQALSQAMMELYKREKINPAAGCLPILVQMPFFLAFYWVLVESVEMRQAPFALWLTDLSSRDPYFILPLIMGAAMLFQQKLNPAPTDPVQARVMQIMPIMFTVFFAFFPSGLVLYWATNTLLSIAQQWKINKVVHAEATAKKQGKKKKPKAKDEN